MAEPFPASSANVNGPSLGPVAITPNDDADLPTPIRAITIGGDAGTISIIGINGGTYTSDTLPNGTYPVFARRVRSTGTTATGLTGWI